MLIITGNIPFLIYCIDIIILFIYINKKKGFLETDSNFVFDKTSRMYVWLVEGSLPHGSTINIIQAI